MCVRFVRGGGEKWVRFVREGGQGAPCLEELVGVDFVEHVPHAARLALVLVLERAGHVTCPISDVSDRDVSDHPTICGGPHPTCSRTRVSPLSG